MAGNRLRAIILRRTNYGEADRILQMLTETGKRSVIAKGVRREKSRLAGGVELFAICEVVITEGKGDMGVLTSSRILQFYNHILEDYDKLQFGYVAIKLVSKASETLDGPEWYDILSETLMGLNAHSIDLQLVETWFYLHYAALLGHELSLWNDINGEKINSDSNYIYDIADKGLRQTPNGYLAKDHIKLLRLISTKPLKVLAQIGGIQDLLDDCLLVSREHAAV